ncbi:class I SAM-dependent methyltransferase [Clostridium estertheticum]|uniref:class I SAM-dependent methyltransferase n=1 Tax=Clostridium estertheticum TaxID=238834 RepID=UPI0013E9178E|nr:class I SAM-dependent methyltransferase [Clostridium estertheticum]MBZ9687431.1 class I SAM-dependent methyltransferase [Clostridium estertheticum]
MNNYWDNVWTSVDVKDYKKYINLNDDYKFIDIFKQHKISNICDAACVFGKYSAIFSKNNFKVSGFDISEQSIILTKNMLTTLNLGFMDFCVCSITDIKYRDECFEGVIAHAVLDHLNTTEAIKALNELFRITKKNGLIYLSFDGLSDNDIEACHEVLADGSFKYIDGTRKGMIFKYYINEEIKKLIMGKEILYFNTKQNGEREVILRKI